MPLLTGREERAGTIVPGRPLPLENLQAVARQERYFTSPVSLSLVNSGGGVAEYGRSVGNTGILRRGLGLLAIAGAGFERISATAYRLTMRWNLP